MAVIDTPIPITSLIDGVTVKNTDIYPAVDPTDLLQAPTGTTKRYTVTELQTYMQNNLNFSVPTQAIIPVSTTTVLNSSAFGAIVQCTGATPYSVTLPTHSANKIIQFTIQTSANALVTLVPSSGLINGQTSIIYGTGEGCQLFDDGTNYWIMEQNLQPVSFLVSLVGNAQSTPSSVQTVIQFTIKPFDVGNFFNTTTFTYKPLYPGKYLFTLNLLYTNAVVMQVEALIKRLSATNFGSLSLNSSVGQSTAIATGPIQMNGSTDTVQGVALQNSGSSRPISDFTYMTGVRISNF